MLEIIPKTELTAMVCHSVVYRHRLPDIPTFNGNSIEKNQAAFYRAGNFIVKMVDKYGIIAFLKSTAKEGYAIELKKAGDFYRYWKKYVMGFDSNSIKK